MPEMMRASKNRQPSACPKLGNDARENGVEHRSRKPAGIRVLARAMVAVEQHDPLLELMAGRMGKDILAPLQAKGFERAVMRDAAKRENGAQRRKRGEARGEEAAAGCRLACAGLVGGG